MADKDDKAAKEYARVMGSEALERQQDLAATTCSICFGKHGQHSQLCPRRKSKDAQP